MLDMYDSGNAPTQPPSNASDSMSAVDADALPCSTRHAPLPGSCLVPDAGDTAGAVVATGMPFPDLAPPADLRASIEIFRVADGAPSPTARYAVGPAPPIYIVYHRFLS